MPYVSEKIRIAGTQYDGRMKLTESDKEEIRKIYSTGTKSQNSLAEDYGVSRSLIAIVVNPLRAESVRLRFKEHWKEYGDRAAITKAARELRRKKQRLHKAGLI